MDFSKKHKNWKQILKDLKNQGPLGELVALEKAIVTTELDMILYRSRSKNYEINDKEFHGSFVKELIEQSRDARELSYAPYSHFNVGCAALVENPEGDKKIFTGANVENASYGATLCAERTTVPAAVSKGYRKVLAYAVVVGFDYSMPKKLRQLADNDFITPCGNCRQFTYEFEANPCFVIMAKDKGEVMITLLEYLQPLGFGPRSLGVDASKYSRINKK